MNCLLRMAILASLLLPALSVLAQELPKPSDADGYIFSHNERSPEEVVAARASIHTYSLSLPMDRLNHLPKTVAKLKAGDPLRIVMLGDSIMNDTARSQWSDRLLEDYPQAKITRIVSVRGGTGCWHYRLPGKLQSYVLDCHPDLVMIGGISQRGDIAAIRDCLQQLRDAGCTAEVMLTSGPYGIADPFLGTDWRDQVRDANTAEYAQQLQQLANEFSAEYFDLQQAWGDYLRAGDKPLAFYKRDEVHANAAGEAVLAEILKQYFAPPKD